MNCVSRCRANFPLAAVLQRRPDAIAQVRGRDGQNAGTVRFYQTNAGTVVFAELRELPCGFLGFHIHGGSACTGTAADPFSDAGMHFDPEERPHPFHAGDLPPLLSNGGLAVTAFLTNRFTVQEVVGRTVIVHDQPDDFTAQPSGNAGEKLACGIIRRR